MRRISRLRAPVPAGFCPSSLPTNTPVRASTVTATTSRSQTSSSSPRTFQTRPLTTTPIRTSQSQIQSSEELDFPEDYDTTNTPQLPASNLVYPRGITAAPAPAEVTDASYKPAETAEGLAEVGGLSGWWDEPSHWGSAEGPAAAVRAVLNTFGKNNAVEVEDKAVLEVIARRAVVEALAVKKFMEKEAGKVGAVDELFACNLEVGAEKLGEIVGTKVVAGKDGQATFGDSKEGQRVFGLLRDAVKVKRAEAKKTQKVQAEKGEEEEMKKGEAVVEEVKAQEAAPALTPEVAQEMIQSWDQGWRKAELRDPVVKFYVAKRIQQLTGRRIHDGKLCAIKSVDSLLKELIEPPKPKKLAELVESKGVFKDLPNVRVFPRRVTPIDKEKMVGRWKVIVEELNKRELPVTGTGDYGEAVEKKWIEGRV